MKKQNQYKCKILNLIIIVMYCCVLSNGQENNCLDEIGSLNRHQNQKVVKHLTMKEVKRQVIHCEVAKVPSWWCGTGEVLVKIVINKEGQVESSCVVYDTFSMGKIAEQTALKWTFKPYLLNGSPITVSAIIPINISWNRPLQVPLCSD